MPSDYTRTVSIPIPASESGKVARKCPRPGCQPAVFLLGGAPNPKSALPADAAIRRAPQTVGTTCPYCGHDGTDEAFQPPELQAHIKRQTEWELQRFANDVLDDLMKPLAKSLKQLERSTRGGMIQIKTSLKKTPRVPRARPMSRGPDDLLRNVACHVCKREYGVYAIGLFCPDCGAANLSVHVEREAELVAHEIADADELHARGELERAVRRIGNAHEDIATAMETYLKTVFIHISRRRLTADEASAVIAKIGNAFQNVERGRKQFERFDFDPFDSLVTEEVVLLSRLMSKRHVAAHNLGLADEKYVAQVGDGRPGVNISLTADDLQRFLDILRQVVRHCETSVPELSSAASTRAP